MAPRALPALAALAAMLRGAHAQSRLMADVYDGESGGVANSLDFMNLDLLSLPSPTAAVWNGWAPTLSSAVDGALSYASDSDFAAAIPNFNLDKKFLVRFRGAIDIPTDGDYQFQTGSDDGSMLYIQQPATHIPQACVTGANIAGSRIDVSSPAECEQHCLDTPGCVGFEYGVDHGGSSDTYPAGSCFPQSGTDIGRTHMERACVSGANIPGTQILGTTVAQCQQHCLDTDGCVGFEYGVDHGGSNTNYPPGSCFPQASADSAGCDGVLMNLDLYLLDSPCNGANYNLDMYIINEQVVNNDGNHGFEEKDGTVSLTAGVHFITVTYFENRFSEELQVKWTPTP